MIANISDEAELYRRLAGLKADVRTGLDEGVRTAPLLTWDVKETLEGSSSDSADYSESRNEPRPSKVLDQYAVLGFRSKRDTTIRDEDIILMNVNAPNSTFICGSQGSGKSYTLNCMLENCLIADKRIGSITAPVAGLAFHFDQDSAQSVAETAYLCSIGIRVKVLVSQSNEHVLRRAYSGLPGAEQNLTVAPLLLHPTDLSIERMYKLMAFADKDGSVPLYMQVAHRILRKMATKSKGGAFDYLEFKSALKREDLTRDQVGPLNLRLDLLESYMDLNQKKRAANAKSVVDLEPGTLTIIDLTDPFMEPATACTLFEICLSLVKEQRPPCGMVVALDEAHKYMNKSTAASFFTDKLLGIIREQRHNATRVIIATQEPTISDKLLDLCTTSIVHRFTSPAWFAAIRDHLGAASNMLATSSAQQDMFDNIMNLGVGESLVFAPSAIVSVAEDGSAGRLGRSTIQMRTRQRLGTDGGASVLASAPNRSDLGSEVAIDLSDQTTSDDEAFSSPPRANVSKARGKLPEPIMEDDRNGGVVLEEEVERPQSPELVKTLNNQRAHLLMICCACSGMVVIEYADRTLPILPGNYSKKTRGATAYTTCTTCRFRSIPRTKKASKDFDHRASARFGLDAQERDETSLQTAQTILKPMLGHDLPLLTQENKPVYLKMRIAQNSFPAGVLLWTFAFANGKTSGQKGGLTKHRNGVFFDSALQKED